MQAQKYKLSNRNFHDAWAFILYIIFTAGANTYYFLQPVTLKMEQLPPPLAISVTLGTIALSFILMTFSFCFFAEAMLHIGCIGAPIASIILACLSGDILAICIAAIYGVISLGLYLAVYRKHIKYSAMVLESSARIIGRYAFILGFTIVVTAAIIVLQVFIALSRVNEDAFNNRIIFLLLFMQLYWTYFNSMYFFTVFSSSIVALDIFTLGLNVNITLESFKNTLYSLGSIAFGGLLVALIATARLAVTMRTDERERRSLISQIFSAIILFILRLLEDIVKFVNKWTFTYMAVHGDSYTNSIKNAFQAASRGNNNILLNSLVIMPIIQLYSLGISILVFSGLALSIKVYVKNVVGYVVLFAISYVILSLGLSTYDSCSKAFLFAYEKDPRAVREKYFKTYEALELQKGRTDLK